MTPARLERASRDLAEALFHDALDLPSGSDVSTWLDSRCDDLAVRDEVLSLIDSHRRRLRADAAARQDADRVPSSQFGPYVAVSLLGRGGMSVVYRAQRVDGQFEDTVALKVLASHLRTPDFERYFDRERQLLATLRHHHVATLIDGGISSNGEPYLVTELVDGRPLDTHADDERLGTGARVALIQQVCEAVDYAHRQLVVHGDLKPGNILVNRDGLVKLLDFGTARLLAAHERVTVTRDRMLTPRYASPEQLRGERITVASDVYAIGVLAYELLTGASPFGSGASIADTLARAAGTLPVVAPTAAITAGAAQQRGTSVEALARTIRGDLTAILVKALAHEADGRYESVRAFADDLDRYLHQRTVRARGNAPWYRVRRFLRRHRRRVAIAATASALVIGAMGYGAVQYTRAQRRLAQIRTLSDSLLSDIYREVSGLPGSTRARLMIVERTQQQLDAVLADNPDNPALRVALAQAYVQLAETLGEPFAISLGDSSSALVNFRKAEALAAGAGPSLESRALVIRARQGITEVLIRAGDYDAAVQTARAALAHSQQLWNEAPAGFDVVGRPVGAVHVRINAVLGHAMMRAADVTRDIAGVRQALAQFERTMAIAALARRRDPALLDLEGRYSQYVAYAYELLGDYSGDPAYYEQARGAHARSADASRLNFERAPSAQTKRDYADGLLWRGWAESLCARHVDAATSTARALALFEEVAAEHRDSNEVGLDLAVARFRLGAVLTDAGRSAEGRAQLERAATMVALPSPIRPTDREVVVLFVQIHEHLATARLALHDRKGAVAALTAAVEAVRGGSSVPPWRVTELERRLAAVAGR